MPGLPLFRSLRILPLILAALTFGTPAHARDPKPSKYSLRIHVLAAGVTHGTPRTSPGSVACDTIDDILSVVTPNPGGPVTLSGVSCDPCSFHADIVTGRYLDSPDEEPASSGEGRGSSSPRPLPRRPSLSTMTTAAAFACAPDSNPYPRAGRSPEQSWRSSSPQTRSPSAAAAPAGQVLLQSYSA